jgi:hypothetical protein
MVISKSEYIMFLKHPAWLWLKKNDKSKLPEPGAELQALFDSGNLFESYAEKLFPQGIKLGFSNYADYAKLPKKTLETLDRGAKTIFQGRFEGENTTCIIDVLDRVEDNVFDLYEIKASTGAKPEHEHDLAFQVIVLEAAGLTVRKALVIHSNNQYVRKGEIDPKKLSSITDITEKVRTRIDETGQNIKKALEVVALKNMPDPSPRYASLGAYNDWFEIYKTLRGEISNYSIYNLYSPGAKKIGQLEEMGAAEIFDIPDDFKLTSKQKWQVDATKTGKRHIDKINISAFLESLKYPLYFLDYETFSSVIPAFDGVRPYQQVPFQYSLHIIKSPGAKVEHREYLHTKNTHPGKLLLKKLNEDIESGGSVLVWYESFEKGCNDTLGEMFPEHKDFLTGVNERIVDLMVPFANGWFVDKDFFGSVSIKNVLPVLVPQLSYKDLNIHGGNTAQRIWMETIIEGRNSTEKKKILNDLIEYCKLDTLAMVEIWKVLISV